MNLRQRCDAPVDAAALVWFRVAFGLLMAWELGRYLAFGWVRDYWIEPTFHFTFYGFDWVRPWPGDTMIVHFVVLIVLALMIAVGAWYRIAAALFTIGFAHLFLIDQTQYLNHFYAIILFGGLLALAPANVDASVDALRRPALRSSTVPVWTVWTLRAQIGFIYFFGGVAKLNPDWFAGQPLTLWLQESQHLPEFMKSSAGLYLSWGGAALDLFIVPLLLWRRTRVVGLVLATTFHLANAWIFHIGIFPWMSIAATLMFLRPDHPLFVATLKKARIGASSRTITTPKFVFAVLVLWLTSQVVLPLRPYLYDTHVHWTEDGHCFSWHMKLRSKRATGHFWVQRAGEQARTRVDPDEHLTERQIYKMMTRPDMLLQYAHFLGERAGPGASVYAQVFAGLNARDPVLFVDPKVDLMRESRTLGATTWVEPSPQASARDR